MKSSNAFEDDKKDELIQQSYLPYLSPIARQSRQSSLNTKLTKVSINPNESENHNAEEHFSPRSVK